MTVPKPSKKAAPAGKSGPTSPPVRPARQRADWEAIERDYRTGRFSDQELAHKHDNIVSRQAIAKMAKKRGWVKDLSDAVRLATKASIIHDQVAARVAGQVAEKVAEGCDATLVAVLAAAEVNKQVIVGHRKDISRLHALTMRLADSLEKAADEPDEKKRPPLPELVLTGQRLTQSVARLQALERIAFSLDEKDDPAGAEGGAATALTEAQRASRLATLLEKARRAREAAVAAGETEDGDAA